MGIRFACHVCSKRLNIKQELAGRRGICPACAAKFRIPLADAETSLPIESTRRRAATNGRGAGPSSPDRQIETDAESSAVATADFPLIDLIDDDPTSTWYVRPPNGGQYGPATGEILRQWISEGRVASNSLLWREGWPQWREAQEVLPDLASRLPDPAGEPSMASPADVIKRDADQFGYGDPAPVGSTDAVALNGKQTTPNGRSNLGADRRSKTNRRTNMIAGLTGLAIILVFALAFVLSR